MHSRRSAWSPDRSETATALAERLQRRRHLRRVPFRAHLLEDRPDPSIRADDVGGASDAHILAAIERLLDPESVLLRHLVVEVRQKRERKVVLLPELLVALDRVGGNAEDDGLPALEAREEVAELARLLRAAGGVVLWIEVEDDGLAAECRELQGLADVGGESEGWSELADGWGH